MRASYPERGTLRSGSVRTCSSGLRGGTHEEGPAASLADRARRRAGRARSSPRPPFAHLERPSYWPDPAPDRSVWPAGRRQGPRRALARVGGQAARGRARCAWSARAAAAGSRSACSTSRSSKARKHGYRAPPEPAQAVPEPRAGAQAALAEPRARARGAATSEIQPAVYDSHNNDRVVVMPGVYTEPTSRAQPLNDPRCADLTQEDTSGAKTPSYNYQVTCPNDQNLIHIQGRAVPDEPPPSPPLTNRHGHPGPRALRALQPPARGQRRGADRRDHRRRVGLRVG